MNSKRHIPVEHSTEGNVIRVKWNRVDNDSITRKRNEIESTILKREVSVENLKKDRMIRNNIKADELYEAILNSIKRDNDKGQTSAIYVIERNDSYCIKELREKLTKGNFYSKIHSRKKFADNNHEIHLKVRWDYTYDELMFKRKTKCLLSILAIILFINLFRL